MLCGMNRLTMALALSMASSLACAQECAAPPVESSAQAVCYATAYARKNDLPLARSLQRRAARGKSAWTVSFTDSREKAPSAGWQVNVDTATGTITRFKSFKKPERKSS
jgi:hypothetical protein